MNCIEFRHLILADPYAKPSKAEAHLATCAQCTRFKQEILNLDSDIEKALSVEVPEGLAARILLNQSLKQTRRQPPRWAQFAIAASFLAAAIFGATLLSVQESGNGTDALLAHASHQSHEFIDGDHQPISNEDLEVMMAQLHITASLDNVVYAAICPIDGKNAVHLVIKDGDDQYTVMLVPEHSPSKMYTVDDKLWRGYISPHPAGALAVLAEANDKQAVARIREVTDKLQSAIYLSAEI
ncbi:MAG: tRNA pseudouridine-54 N-methylase [bacterium]|jgi:tRNA pseudouridine-54 N-methylase